MEFTVEYLVSAVVILLFLGGIALFRSPRTARLGDWLNILAYAGAVAFVVIRYPALGLEFVLIAVLLGGTLGAILAARVSMVSVPQMIAFQHGCGGTAAFLIAFSEFIREGAGLTTLAQVGSVLGMLVGAVTFSGSLIAAGKLAGKIKGQPVFLPGHLTILFGLLGLMVLLSVFAVLQIGLPIAVGLAIGLIVVSVIVGVIFTIRIGGADMPVIISFFNATAGFAAAFCGIALSNYLLIGCGACVAASGSLLTITMCRAMNRSLLGVFSGIKPSVAGPEEVAGEVLVKANGMETSPFDRAVAALKQAKDVIIVPGYGMAAAQAQFKVWEMAQILESRGVRVRFAIHPVAGRMPGHMNVLLAEAGVPYDKLLEMDAINGDFKNTDVAVVVGASDIVNPAALREEGTPISGMPILKAYEAKTILICKRTKSPGFSGVENPLFEQENTIFLAGDAKETIARLIGVIDDLMKKAEK
ncbi:NAD(P) transhydrogenase subunit beta [subsurface metagenome]